MTLTQRRFSPSARRGHQPKTREDQPKTQRRTFFTRTHQPFMLFASAWLLGEANVPATLVTDGSKDTKLINSETSHSINYSNPLTLSSKTTTMNAITSILVLFLASVQLSSSLLFSPLLLRANPFGVVRSTAMAKAPAAPTMEAIVSTPVDYGHDDDVLRYKYELLQSVYEKSLGRGFEQE